jgi:ankyrin repeat protein
MTKVLYVTCIPLNAFQSLKWPILQPDKSGRTALHWAAISGHTDVVKFLLLKGANIFAETGSKMNALHGAVEGGRVETVRALMEFVQGKEDVKVALTMARNGDDKTAWDISAAAKNRAICQILKDLGDSNGASSSCTLS